MKLRNKKTGEIVSLDGELLFDDKVMLLKQYNSLAELNEEWEDYEEPKEHWCITMYGGITRIKDDEEPVDDLKEIGDYFNSKEDAYDALDKLKAWKRLKDGGFRFDGYSHYDWNGNESPAIAFEYSDFDKMFDDKRVVADLDLLFGGEE